VYVPMLFAFVVSWFQAGYILVIKTIAQRVNISDFTFFSYFVSSSFYLTTALIYWNTHEGSFSPYFLKIGMFGSIIQVCGGVSLNLAISKAKAAGPAIAVVSCSMIMLTILASLLDGTIPSLMQNLGLLLGVTGALILVIPDHLKRLFKQ